MEKNATDILVSAICAEYESRPDRLLEILHDLQAELRCLSPDIQDIVAQKLNISRAEVHGVVSFYDDFHEAEKSGRIVRLCKGEACQAQGAAELKNFAIAHQEKCHGSPSSGDFFLDPVFCLGNCALGPCAQVDGQLKARLTLQSFRDLLPTHSVDESAMS